LLSPEFCLQVAEKQQHFVSTIMTFGIDDMALHVPKIYLDIHTLAEKRGIAYEKLSRGLGLHKMAFCDAHEDAATMAAEAII
jgi:hydroxymethylglutaryl-CoA synthase